MLPTSAFLHNNKGIIDENTQYIAWTRKKKYTVNSWDEFSKLDKNLFMFNTVVEIHECMSY
jgi:hypothetical protein